MLFKKVLMLCATLVLCSCGVFHPHHSGYDQQKVVDGDRLVLPKSEAKAIRGKEYYPVPKMKSATGKAEVKENLIYPPTLQ